MITESDLQNQDGKLYKLYDYFGSSSQTSSKFLYQFVFFLSFKMNLVKNTVYQQALI